MVSDDQKLDWADIFLFRTLPTRLRKPYLLPMIPLPYREILKKYSRELETLAKRILDYMAKALNMDVEDMRKAFGEGKQSLRPDQTIGLTPHSDSVSNSTKSKAFKSKKRANGFMCNQFLMHLLSMLVTFWRYKTTDANDLVESKVFRVEVGLVNTMRRSDTIGRLSKLESLK